MLYNFCLYLRKKRHFPPLLALQIVLGAASDAEPPREAARWGRGVGGGRVASPYRPPLGVLSGIHAPATTKQLYSPVCGNYDECWEVIVSVRSLSFIINLKLFWRHWDWIVSYSFYLGQMLTFQFLTNITQLYSPCQKLLSKLLTV